MATTESPNIPAHFQIEPELREQLSNRPGHQRCLEGGGELLLIVHEVPDPRNPDRVAWFYWKCRDGRWFQATGAGLGGLRELLDRYAAVIDRHEATLDSRPGGTGIFPVLHHAGPLLRASRNLVQALEQALALDPDDREIRVCRDRAREVERAAELLSHDARLVLEYWHAERHEHHARATDRLNRVAHRLNMMAGFFLPIVAISGVLGMNVELPAFVRPMFWGILASGLLLGAGLLVMIMHRHRKNG